MDSKFDKRLREFAADDFSGSAELAERALNIIYDFCKSYSPNKIVSNLSKITDSLVKSQPSMAAVINIVHWAEGRIRKLIEDERMGEISSLLEKMSKQRELEERQTINRASMHLEKFACVSTYSRSSLVEKSLLQLSRNGFRPEIFVSESRPGNEGITLAETLSDAGLDVKVCVDAALPDFIIRSEAFIIGTDAIEPVRFCNKIGTSVMCRTAFDNGIPAYVIATREKLLPDKYSSLFIIKDRPPGEVYKGGKSNIAIFNRLFEWCENEMVTEFILPDGCYQPLQIRKQFERLIDD